MTTVSVQTRTFDWVLMLPYASGAKTSPATASCEWKKRWNRNPSVQPGGAPTCRRLARPDACGRQCVARRHKPCIRKQIADGRRCTQMGMRPVTWQQSLTVAAFVRTRLTGAVRTSAVLGRAQPRSFGQAHADTVELRRSCFGVPATPEEWLSSARTPNADATSCASPRTARSVWSASDSSALFSAVELNSEGAKTRSRMAAESKQGSPGG